MRSARLELRVEPELLARIDAACGDVPRSRWVVRALEQALGGEAVEQPAGQVSGVVSPSRLEEANDARGPAGRVSSSRASAPASARAHRPERHEFSSGEDWQAAVRAWKARR